MADETTNTTTAGELGIIQVNSHLLTNIDDFMWNSTTEKGNESLTEVDCPFPFVITAKRAFKGCTKLATFTGGSDESIETKGFPRLENASEMLCKTAITQFSTQEVPMGSVTNASKMLQDCSNLDTVHLTMNSVTNADDIVDGCTNLKYVTVHMDSLGQNDDKTLTLHDGVLGANVSLLKAKHFALPSTVATSSVRMGAMQDCSQLIPSNSALTQLWLQLSGATTFGGNSLPASLTHCHLQFGALENADNLLRGCSNITSKNFSISGLSNLKSANNMFNGCSGMSNWTWSIDLPVLTSANGMFMGCIGLQSITSKMPKLVYASSMFESCPNLEYAYLHLAAYDSKVAYEVSSLKDGTRMFYGCTSLNGVCSSITSVGNTKNDINLNALENGTQMFRQCTSIKFNSFYSELSSLINGFEMFYGTTHLESFGKKLTNQNKQWLEVPMVKLKNGTRMFSGIDDGHFNNLTNFFATAKSLVDGSYMFAYNPKLTGYDALGATITFSMGNTTTTGISDVTAVLNNGSSMFQGCGLTKFNEGNIDLTGLVYGDNMFKDCKNLTQFGCKCYSLLAGMNMFCGCKLDNTSLEYIAQHINDLVEHGWVKYNDEGKKEYLRTVEWKYKMWSDTVTTTIAEGDEGGQSNITEVAIPDTSRAVIHVDYAESVTDPQILSFEKSLHDKGWTVTSCTGANTNLNISEDNKVDTEDKSFVEDIPAWKEQRYVRYNMNITSITSRTNAEGIVEGVMYGTSDVKKESTETGDEGTES